MLECKEYETESVKIYKETTCRYCNFLICEGSIAHKHKENNEYICPLCWDDLRRVENNEKI